MALIAWWWNDASLRFARYEVQAVSLLIIPIGIDFVSFIDFIAIRLRGSAYG